VTDEKALQKALKPFFDDMEKAGFIHPIRERNALDPRLSEAALANFAQSVQAVAVTRAAVLEALPRDVTRVVGVMSVEVAQDLMRMKEILDGKTARSPPAGYVPPTRD
jgi:hypothetical protein